MNRFAKVAEAVRQNGATLLQENVVNYRAGCIEFLREMKNVPEFRILNEGERFVGTIAVVHQSDHSEKIAYWLNENKICVRGGFQCSALAHKTLNTTVGGVIRVSMGYRNTEKDVIDCVKCLKNYQKN